MSSMASAWDGITFWRNPALKMVGEMEVRRTEYFPGRVQRSSPQSRATLRIHKAAVTRSFLGGTDCRQPLEESTGDVVKANRRQDAPALMSGGGRTSVLAIAYISAALI